MGIAEMLKSGGWAVWPLVALCLPGLIVGVLGLGLRDKRSRHYLGLTALVLSTTLSALAIAGALSIREEGSHAQELADSATSLQRMTRALAIDARIPLRLGLGAALIPLLGGITGAFSVQRPRRGKPLSTRSLRGPVAPFGSFSAAVVLAAAAISAASVVAVLLLTPLPGPSLPIDSPAWKALEAMERMKAGDTGIGCTALERAATDGGTDPRLVPNVQSAVTECFELRLAEALSMPPPREIELLQALYGSALPMTKDQRKRVLDELEQPGLYPPTPVKESTEPSPEVPRPE